MPLSIFVDALPFTEIQKNYSTWLPTMQLAELQPNIGYSSSLHWQLYCNKYPDDRNTFLDWSKKTETQKIVRVIAKCLSFLDGTGILGVVVKKVLDRFIFRRNVFANIPFKFRGDFCETGKYLFWDKNTYDSEPVFSGYKVLSQDEGHISFDTLLNMMDEALEGDNPNIMLITGFADEIGHRCSREGTYSQLIRANMDKLRNAIVRYSSKYPDEEVLIVSDHGMSTIHHRVDLKLTERFGKQSTKNYIAYSDSCIMCVWSKDILLLSRIAGYLQTRTEGHLLDDNERKYYEVTNRDFGDLIFILREGNVFSDSWFGKSLRKKSRDGEGMHGFWPELTATDQMAGVILLSPIGRVLKKKYDYREANKLICSVMADGH